MPSWLVLIDGFAALTVILVGVLAALFIRRRTLTRGGVGFEMSVNRTGHASAQGWILGVAVYGRAEVEWYRTFSLSWRPSHRFPRGGVLVGRRRDPAGTEVYALHDGHVIVDVDEPGGVQQLAMSPMALTGLLAWLESSPPGDPSRPL